VSKRVTKKLFVSRLEEEAASERCNSLFCHNRPQDAVVRVSAVDGIEQMRRLLSPVLLCVSCSTSCRFVFVEMPLEPVAVFSFCVIQRAIRRRQVAFINARSMLNTAPGACQVLHRVYASLLCLDVLYAISARPDYAN